MTEPIINCTDSEQADFILLGIPYDKTACGRKGTCLGPDAIVKCLNEDVEFWERYTQTDPGHTSKIYYENLSKINSLSPDKMVSSVHERYKELLNYSKPVCLLGGEHSISIGGLKAISEKFSPDDITIVQIDAHADMRDDDANSNPHDSEPSKYAHSCVMRRAVEMGYNIIQIGLRSFCQEEYDYIQQHKDKITSFEWGIGSIPAIQEIIAGIKTEKVYLSLDVDGIDPAFMPATGTPVQGGLEWYYANDLIRSVIAQKEVVGCDIVEVSPTDTSELTEYGAAQICYSIIAHTLKKKQG